MDYSKLISDLQELFDHDYKYAEWNVVSEDILRDDDTPTEILDKLYELDKTNLAALRGISAHPNASEDILELLSIDKNDAVRWGVAENSNTSSMARPGASVDFTSRESSARQTVQ